MNNKLKFPIMWYTPHERRTPATPGVGNTERRTPVIVSSFKLVKLIKLALIFLSGCSVWNEKFEEPIPKALPKASIHQISVLIDKGVIKETDVDDESNSASAKRRIFLMPYEDSSKVFHDAHNIYMCGSNTDF